MKARRKTNAVWRSLLIVGPEVPALGQRLTLPAGERVRVREVRPVGREWLPVLALVE